MFLVATLYFDGARSAVRVRNMSDTGALIEGASLPEAGAKVILRRGALEAPATTAWSRSGKSGLTFSGPVDLTEWLPTKEAKRQSQVDQIAFGLKHAGRKVACGGDLLLEPKSSMLAIVADLTELQAQLGRLGDQLSGDAFVLVNHPEVQALDAAGQQIGRIIAALSTEPVSKG